MRFVAAAGALALLVQSLGGLAAGLAASDLSGALSVTLGQVHAESEQRGAASELSKEADASSKPAEGADHNDQVGVIEVTLNSELQASATRLPAGPREDA
eukprot:TRINITY_DN22241_c0_g1_i1.p1 TRINITY_DN22241_c0_g1~~TRINITY_DN22241_c0_g1_i1.p1  ORF type:complete len:100 (+),score=22.78 TRINITY_DN22241_c0_g1_i1:96-395(+)